jgi:hypothetical protein
MIMGKKLIGMFALALMAHSSFAQGVENYVTGEAGACDTMEPGDVTRAMRMRSNAVIHAQAYCAGTTIKIGGSVRDFIVEADGTSPPFCRLSGKIECNPPPALKPIAYNPGAPASRIQNCQIANMHDLGYIDGNKHDFCLKKGWNGGALANPTNGTCWKFDPTKNPQDECPRLNNYYQQTSGLTCQHLSAEDATKLHVCGHN